MEDERRHRRQDQVAKEEKVRRVLLSELVLVLFGGSLALAPFMRSPQRESDDDRKEGSKQQPSGEAGKRSRDARHAQVLERREVGDPQGLAHGLEGVRDDGRHETRKLRLDLQGGPHDS